jgi:hypothetical protein
MHMTIMRYEKHAMRVRRSLWTRRVNYLASYDTLECIDVSSEMAVPDGAPGNRTAVSPRG